MAAAGTLELLGREVAHLFQPLGDWFTPDNIGATLTKLGLQVPSELTAAPALVGALGKVGDSVAALFDLLVQLEDAVDAGNAGTIVSTGDGLVGQINNAAAAVAGVASALNALSASLAGLSAPQRAALQAFAEIFVERLMELLAVDWLRRRFGRLYIALVVVGAIEIVDFEGGSSDSLQSPYRRFVLHFDRFLRLATDPLGLIRDVYRWGDADFDGVALFRVLEILLADRTALPVVLLQPPGMPATLEVGIVSATVDPSGPLPGLEISLRTSASGESSDSLAEDDWTFDLSAKATVAANAEFVVKPPLDVHLQAPPGSVDAALAANFGRTPSAAPLVVFGETDGSRLEITSFTAGASFTGHWEPGGPPVSIVPTLQAAVQSGTLYITGEGGDSFVTQALQGVDIAAPFDLAISWSPTGGISFGGGAAINIATHVTIGPITVDSVSLGLEVDEQNLLVDLAATVGVRLGPVLAEIETLGVRASLGMPPGGGNVGPIQVDFSFLPPSGVGLSVDAAGVTGGGFLAHDASKGEYSGVLQLQYIDLALQAFGLITTRVAGGDGYSLFALVDAEFPPVQLGWGFTLNGVGGLLAVNRTASTDALHAALKAGQLSTILFPKNAISNAPAVLGQIDTLFPIAPGRFLFGPMALIGWGTPQILSAAIAVVVELPEPVRVILLARIEARLPDASNALVRINMDALGVLDLSQDELSFDAVLFDSKLVGYTLSGAMALRATWATQRTFLLSIGGVHPQFTPPPGFPALQRIAIDMSSGSISKMRMAAYLALTSNSIQFGATLDVMIGVSGFGLSGHLGFDALLQQNPFRFTADISGSVAIMAGGDDIASVSLDATLSGPAPYHIAGTFKIHVIFFDVHYSFDESWGDDAPSLPTPSVDVDALLRTALAQRDSWNVQLREGMSPLVSMRSVGDAAHILAHPLAQPEVHESIVPLGLAITRFGEAVPSGPATFTITALRLGAAVVATETIEDNFAPSLFFDLSDDEKLMGPSYEQHDAGVRMTSTPVATGAPVAKTTAYETYFIDTPGAAPRIDTGVVAQPASGDLLHLIGIGAVGRAAISRSGQRYQTAGNPIRVAEPAFVLADPTTLARAAVGPAAGATFSQMRALLAQHRNLQIVATHEMTMN